MSQEQPKKDSNLTTDFVASPSSEVNLQSADQREFRERIEQETMQSLRQQKEDDTNFKQGAQILTSNETTQRPTQKSRRPSQNDTFNATPRYGRPTVESALKDVRNEPSAESFTRQKQEYVQAGTIHYTDLEQMRKSNPMLQFQSQSPNRVAGILGISPQNANQQIYVDPQSEFQAIQPNPEALLQVQQHGSDQATNERKITSYRSNEPVKSKSEMGRSMSDAQVHPPHISKIDIAGQPLLRFQLSGDLSEPNFDGSFQQEIETGVKKISNNFPVRTPRRISFQKTHVRDAMFNYKRRNFILNKRVTMFVGSLDHDKKFLDDFYDMNLNGTVSSGNRIMTPEPHREKIRIKSRSDLRDIDQIPTDIHYFTKQHARAKMNQELDKALKIKGIIERLPEGKLSHVPYHMYIPSSLKIVKKYKSESPRPNTLQFQKRLQEFKKDLKDFLSTQPFEVKVLGRHLDSMDARGAIQLYNTIKASQPEAMQKKKIYRPASQPQFDIEHLMKTNYISNLSPRSQQEHDDRVYACELKLRQRLLTPVHKSESLASIRYHIEKKLERGAITNLQSTRKQVPKRIRAMMNSAPDLKRRRAKSDNMERKDLLESPIYKAYKFTSMISKNYEFKLCSNKKQQEENEKSPKFRKLYERDDDSVFENQADRLIDEGKRQRIGKLVSEEEHKANQIKNERKMLLKRVREKIKRKVARGKDPDVTGSSEEDEQTKMTKKLMDQFNRERGFQVFKSHNEGSPAKNRSAHEVSSPEAESAPESPHNKTMEIEKPSVKAYQTIQQPSTSNVVSNDPARVSRELQGVVSISEVEELNIQDNESLDAYYDNEDDRVDVNKTIMSREIDESRNKAKQRIEELKTMSAALGIEAFNTTEVPHQSQSIAEVELKPVLQSNAKNERGRINLTKLKGKNISPRTKAVISKQSQDRIKQQLKGSDCDVCSKRSNSPSKANKSLEQRSVTYNGIHEAVSNLDKVMSDLAPETAEVPHLWCMGKEDTDYIQQKLTTMKDLRPPRNQKKRMRTAVGQRGINAFRSRATNVGSSSNATKDKTGTIIQNVPSASNVTNIKGVAINSSTLASPLNSRTDQVMFKKVLSTQEIEPSKLQSPEADKSQSTLPNIALKSVDSKKPSLKLQSEVSEKFMQQRLARTGSLWKEEFKLKKQIGYKVFENLPPETQSKLMKKVKEKYDKDQKQRLEIIKQRNQQSSLTQGMTYADIKDLDLLEEQNENMILTQGSELGAPKPQRIQSAAVVVQKYEKPPLPASLGGVNSSINGPVQSRNTTTKNLDIKSASLAAGQAMVDELLGNKASKKEMAQKDPSIPLTADIPEELIPMYYKIARKAKSRHKVDIVERNKTVPVTPANQQAANIIAWRELTEDNMRQCDCHIEKQKSRPITTGDALASIQNQAQFNSREYDALADQMDIRMKPENAVNRYATMTQYHRTQDAITAHKKLAKFRTKSRDRFNQVRLQQRRIYESLGTLQDKKAPQQRVSSARQAQKVKGHHTLPITQFPKVLDLLNKCQKPSAKGPPIEKQALELNKEFDDKVQELNGLTDNLDELYAIVQKYIDLESLQEQMRKDMELQQERRKQAGLAPLEQDDHSMQLLQLKEIYILLQRERQIDYDNFLAPSVVADCHQHTIDAALRMASQFAKKTKKKRS